MQEQQGAQECTEVSSRIPLALCLEALLLTQKVESRESGGFAAVTEKF